MSDPLGDRMKLYELAEAGRKLMPLVPILARIDGRAFHAFTRGMQRPFEPELSQAMIATTAALVAETDACMGYTQSDEITLAWHSTDLKSTIWFDGRIAKMVSQLAAQATLHFNLIIEQRLPEYRCRRPTFDARVWNVPNRTEGANVFVWREMDAVKNSITMATGAFYSHEELHGKRGNEKQAMLLAKDVNWNDYPAYFKRGTYVQRRTITSTFTTEEIEQLPPKHAARSDPNLVVERNVIVPLDLPPITRVLNREAIIFDGAEPELAEQA